MGRKAINPQHEKGKGAATIRFRVDDDLLADLTSRGQQYGLLPQLQARRDLIEFYRLIRRCGLDPTDPDYLK